MLFVSVSSSFPKSSQTADSWAGPTATIRVREDGWEEEGLKNPGLKKERHWRRMLPNVPSLPIYFQEDKHKWQLVKRDIGLLISNVTIWLTLERWLVQWQCSESPLFRQPAVPKL